MLLVEEQVLTVAEVAERLRVQPAAVRRWIREGRLEAFMPGGEKTGYRILASELRRFIEERRAR